MLAAHKKKFPQLNSSEPIHEDIVAQIFAPFLQEPANKECADCLARGPKWSSTNLGIFICIKCSGIHRSMGTHISKVKSTSLDKWLPNQIEFVLSVGNAKAKEIYEACLPPGFIRPRENDMHGLEQFIRAKYERKQYTKKDYIPTSQPVETYNQGKPVRRSGREDDHPLISSDPTNQFSVNRGQPNLSLKSSQKELDPVKRSASSADLINMEVFGEGKLTSVSQTPTDKSFTEFLLSPNPPQPKTSLSYSQQPAFTEFMAATTESKPQASKESILSLFQAPPMLVHPNYYAQMNQNRPAGYPQAQQFQGYQVPQTPQYGAYQFNQPQFQPQMYMQQAGALNPTPVPFSLPQQSYGGFSNSRGL